ncbi:hypothetical protein JYT19_00060 [Sulfobacillus acidophilus]|uniref:Uncharacterized protein n=1 Tax=Sulfobacillus acidophilus TaxID=53633 RepID=A0ABS3AW36_9FIRM|nr:hypothetical protein [Sulfobacillus acidophilus]
MGNQAKKQFTLLNFLSIPILLFNLNCTKIEQFAKANNLKSVQTHDSQAICATKNEGDKYFHPILFARFPYKTKLSAWYKKQEADICSESDLYLPLYGKENKISTSFDLCSPKPLWISKNTIRTKNNKWLLPKTPMEFFWQQHLSAKHSLLVELQDSDGMPWPCHYSITKQGHITTVKINPKIKLPQNEPLYLVALIFNEKGEDIGNWLQKININKGFVGVAPWEKLPAKKRRR